MYSSIRDPLLTIPYLLFHICYSPMLCVSFCICIEFRAALTALTALAALAALSYETCRSFAAAKPSKAFSCRAAHGHSPMAAQTQKIVASTPIAIQSQSNSNSYSNSSSLSNTIQICRGARRASRIY